MIIFTVAILSIIFSVFVIFLGQRNPPVTTTSPVTEGCLVPSTDDIPYSTRVTSSYDGAEKLGGTVTVTCSSGSFQFNCRSGNVLQTARGHGKILSICPGKSNGLLLLFRQPFHTSTNNFTSYNFAQNLGNFDEVNTTLLTDYFYYMKCSPCAKFAILQMSFISCSKLSFNYITIC